MIYLDDLKNKYGFKLTDFDADIKARKEKIKEAGTIAYENGMKGQGLMIPDYSKPPVIKKGVPGFNPYKSTVTATEPEEEGYKPSVFGLTRDEYNRRRRVNPSMPEFGSPEYFEKRAKTVGGQLDSYMQSKAPQKNAHRYAGGKSPYEASDIGDKEAEIIADDYANILKEREKNSKGVNLKPDGAVDVEGGLKENRIIYEGYNKLNDYYKYKGEINPHSSRGYVLPEYAEKMKETRKQKELSSDKIGAYSYFDKHQNNTYKNDLGGVIAGNYRTGDINERIGKVGYTSFKNSTDDIEAAEVYSLLLNKLTTANSETFGEKKGIMKDIASIAGYVPQFLNQTAASTAGTIAGGVVGFFAGNPVLGARIGGSLASADYMYRQTAGAEYVKNLQENNLSIADAKKLAGNTAVATGIVEFGLEYAMSKLWSGAKGIVKEPIEEAFKKVLGGLVKMGMTEKGAEIALKSAVTVGKMAIESLGEGVEEWIQKGMEIQAEKYAKQGKILSVGEIFGKALSFNEYTEKELNSMNESFRAGTVIGFFGGGVHSITYGSINKIISGVSNEKLGNAVVKSDNSDVMIDNAVKYGEQSSSAVTRDLAAQVKADKENGNLKDKKLGKLIRSIASKDVNLMKGPGESEKTGVELILSTLSKGMGGAELSDSELSLISSAPEAFTAYTGIKLNENKDEQIKAFFDNAKEKNKRANSIITAISERTGLGFEYDVTLPADSDGMYDPVNNKVILNPANSESLDYAVVNQLFRFVENKKGYDGFISSIMDSDFYKNEFLAANKFDSEEEFRASVREDCEKIYKNLSGQELDAIVQHHMNAKVTAALINSKPEALARLTVKDSSMKKAFSGISDFFGEIYHSLNGESEKAYAMKKAGQFRKMLESNQYEITRKGNVDDSVIDYNNSSKEGKVNWNSLNDSQRETISFAKKFARAFGLDLVITADGKVNGAFSFSKNTIYLDVYAGIDIADKLVDTVIPTLSHELTHWMELKSPALWKKLNSIVFSTLEKEDGISEKERIQNEIKRIKENRGVDNVSETEARGEIVARACEDMLSLSQRGREMFDSLSAGEKKTFIGKVKEFLNKLINKTDKFTGPYNSISKEAAVMRKYRDKLMDLSAVWDEMLSESTARNQEMKKSGAFKNNNNTDNVVFSEKEIIGVSGQSYGMGVYLDSDELNGLTEVERKKKVKKYVVTKLAGHHFIAYDNNNNVVDIGIAKTNDNIKKRNGKKRKVIEELYRKNINQSIKQEAVVLANELIQTAKYDSPSPSNKPHDWLDNNGKNDWDYWKVYIQEKNKSVWEATLNIANTTNGEKILYDIDPIEKVEGPVKSGPTSTNPIIRNSDKNVKDNSAKINISEALRLSEKEISVNMSDDERYDILKDKKITPVQVQIDEMIDIDFEYLENNIKSVVEKELLSKLQHLGVFRGYTSNSIKDIYFDFTGKGFRKSLHSQENFYGGNKAEFTKILLNLQKLLDSSILIESHTDKGFETDKEKRGLKEVYVLFATMKDGNKLVPVQFEVEQYINEENRLYLSVALTKIETGVKGNTAPDEQKATSLLPISINSISEIFSKINPNDRNFLKYVPNQFLNEEQISAKNVALEIERKKYAKEVYSDKDTSTIDMEYVGYLSDFDAEKRKTVQKIFSTFSIPLNRRTELKAQLEVMFKTVEKGQEISDSSREHLYNILKEKSKIKNTESIKELIALRNEIRTTKIKLSEDVRRNFSPEYIKSLFGHLSLSSTEGRGLDEYHAELLRRFPDVFSKDAVNSADILSDIAEVQLSIKAMKDAEYNFEEAGERSGLYKADFDRMLDDILRYYSYEIIHSKINEGETLTKAQRNMWMEEMSRKSYNALTELEKRDLSTRLDNLINKNKKESEIEKVRDIIEKTKKLPGNLIDNEAYISLMDGAEFSEEAFKEFVKAPFKFIRGNRRGGGSYSNIDIFRVNDIVGGHSETLRTFLRNVIEKPLEEHKRRYVKALEGKVERLYREIVVDLGIDLDSKESAAVQWYGEGQKPVNKKNGSTEPYSLEDLKTEFPDKWENIVKADKLMRRMYNEYIDSINETLKKIYPNVENEVAKLEAEVEAIRENKESMPDFLRADADNSIKILEAKIDSLLTNRRLRPRKDYYRHFQEMDTGITGLINTFRSEILIDPKLVGKSENTNPKSKWWSALQHRGQGAYKSDALGAMLNYIPSAEYKIHIEPFIQHMRAVITSVAHETADSKNANGYIQYLIDWTNDLCGKTNPYDRLFVNEGGRTLLNTLNWFASRERANMILGNLRSAFVQIYNLPNAKAYIKNPSDWVKGAFDAMEFMLRKNHDIEDSVFIRERYMDNIYSKFKKGIRYSPMKLAEFMLTAGDKAVAHYVWYAAFSEAKRKGVSNPHSYADNLVRKAVAGRGIGELPITQKSKVVKLLAPFQVEVNNDWQANKELIKKGDVIGLAWKFAYIWAMNTLARLTIGDDVLPDPIELIKDIIKQFRDDEGVLKNAGQAVGHTVGGLLNAMPYANILMPFMVDITDGATEEFFGDYNPTRYGTGVDGIANIASFVINGLQGKLDGMDWIDMAATYFLPMGGKQVSRSLKGIEDVSRGGSYTDKGELRFPVTTPYDKFQTIVFGAYATGKGKEYLEETKPLSAKNTAIYNKLITMKNGKKYQDKIYETFRDYSEYKKSVGKTVLSKKEREKYVNKLSPLSKLEDAAHIREWFINNVETQQKKK